MAIKPQDDTAFLREVGEEVRKEQALQFWQRWGKWIVAAVVAAVLAFGGWMYWQYRQTAAREAEGEALARLLEDIDGGAAPDAEARLAALAASDSPGYRASALMTRAALALRNGDSAAAARSYAEVAGDANLGQPWRDLALVRQTAIEFGSIPPQQVVDRLAGLAQPGNPWFGSAGEMSAIALMALGREQDAGRMFAAMARDESVPPSMRGRAEQMAGSLGVDALGDDPIQVEAGPMAAAPPPAPAAPAAQPETEAAGNAAAGEASE